MINLRRLLVLPAALALLGCEAAADPTVTDVSQGPLAAAGKGPVVHHASMGGADYCEAVGLPTGCDANFSLVANQHADGSVSGQWQDSFGHGNGGIHVAVDCLAVAGNQAVIGGVVTHGTGLAAGAVGQRAITSVVDNGTSSQDPPDQLSFSFFPVGVDCSINPAVFPLFTLARGQVKVW